ncbi:hypothetical protein DCC81_07815 [Chitinophaga parva]|uniref:Peptidase M10 metallopeptidase domain-containing protein n=1 Tax=Chitinophaga parva TaxID=2169414 RepID=A0A2T7BNW1_9BACT|nr:RHS repeat-associated core domain-containing protein [Chitinophaga parva]PUZ29352.1 hypothetical protein DCC81_07815 [Chitinophaga parva]
MKWLSLLIALLCLFVCRNVQAQIDVRTDPRIAPLLRQAANGQPDLVIFGRKPASNMYVNMAVLDKTSRRLYWFTCYGTAYDSVQLQETEFVQISSNAIDPFSFYRELCLENEVYLDDAVAEYRKLGKLALKDTSYNRRIIYNSVAVQSAHSTLQQLMAIEGIFKKQYLKLCLFNSLSPSLLSRNEEFLLRKSLAGKMVNKPDTTIYYSTSPLGFIAKIVLCRQDSLKMFVYGGQDHVVDSMPLKPGKYTSLLKSKDDVFLLYRGWLELQSQQVQEALLQTTALFHRQDTGLYVQTYRVENKRQLSLAEAQLKRQQQDIERKISGLMLPDKDMVAHMLQIAYPDAPTAITYLSGGIGFAYTVNYKRDEKLYELVDHRGNVMVTVSDKRTVMDNGNETISYYAADVVDASDYYPFGLLMPERSFSSANKYRYGFNGKENDNEIKGEGNQQDYGMRIYDPRVGRFLSLDPLSAQYPGLTPYQFSSNRPIDGIDIDGKEWGQSNVLDYVVGQGFTLLTNNVLRIKVINDSKIITNPDAIKTKAELFAASVEATYTNFHPPMLMPSEVTTTSVFLDYNSPSDNDGNIAYLHFDDRKTSTTTKQIGNTILTQTSLDAGETSGVVNGFVMKVGITVDGKEVSKEDLSLTFRHEAGHSLGLNHPWSLNQEEIEAFPSINQKGYLFKDKKAIHENLLNSGENPNGYLRNNNGSKLLMKQLEYINEQIKKKSLWTPEELSAPKTNATTATNKE